VFFVPFVDKNGEAKYLVVAFEVEFFHLAPRGSPAAEIHGLPGKASPSLVTARPLGTGITLLGSERKLIRL
jgi:hypothetical protein